MLESLGLREVARGRGLVRTTMGKLTTHVLDLAAGTPAAGMRIELHDLGASPPGLLAQPRTNEHGRCLPPPLEGDSLHGGRYPLTLPLAQDFCSLGAKIPAPPL